MLPTLYQELIIPKFIANNHLENICIFFVSYSLFKLIQKRRQFFLQKYSTKSLNGNPSNGNNPLNGNFFNLPNGLLHKTRGFWKLFLQ